MELASSDLVRWKGTSRWTTKKSIGYSWNKHRLVVYSADQFDPAILQTGGLVSVRMQTTNQAKIHRVFLRYTTTVASAAVTPTPAVYWASLIRHLDGNNEFQKFQHDNIRDSLALMSQEQLEYLTRVYNCNVDIQAPNSYPVGTRRTYVPIIGSALEGTVPSIHWYKELISEVTILQSGVLESGTAANFTCSDIAIVLEVEDLSPMELSDYRAKNAISKNIITYDLTSRPSKVFVAGQAEDFELTQAHKCVCFLQFFLRASNVASGGAIRTFQPLSYMPEVSNAQFELFDSSGNTVTNPIDVDFMKYQDNPMHYRSGIFLKNHIYTLLHGEPSEAIKGHIEGFFDYGNGGQGNYNLRIRPAVAGTAETAEVVTIVPRAAGDAATATAAAAGNFQLSYRGDVTTILAFNATIADIQAALRALPSVKKSGEIFTVGGSGANNTAGFTVTISNLSQDYFGQPPSASGGNIGVVNCCLASSGPAALVLDPAITTPGVCATGFLAGTYNVFIYAGRIRNVNFTPVGVTIDDNVFKAQG